MDAAAVGRSFDPPVATWRLADRPIVVFGSGVEYSWNLLAPARANLVERLAAVTELIYVERHGASSKVLPT